MQGITALFIHHLLQTSHFYLVVFLKLWHYIAEITFVLLLKKNKLWDPYECSETGRGHSSELCLPLNHHSEDSKDTKTHTHKKKWQCHVCFDGLSGKPQLMCSSFNLSQSLHEMSLAESLWFTRDHLLSGAHKELRDEGNKRGIKTVDRRDVGQEGKNNFMERRKNNE